MVTPANLEIENHRHFRKSIHEIQRSPYDPFVPGVLHLLINVVQRLCAHASGPYRVNGSAQVIRQLRDQLNALDFEAANHVTTAASESLSAFTFTATQTTGSGENGVLPGALMNLDTTPDNKMWANKNAMCSLLKDFLRNIQPLLISIELFNALNCAMSGWTNQVPECYPMTQSQLEHEADQLVAALLGVRRVLQQRVFFSRYTSASAASAAITTPAATDNKEIESKKQVLTEEQIVQSLQQHALTQAAAHTCSTELEQNVVWLRSMRMLMQHTSYMSRHECANSMTARNLAVCFSPAMLKLDFTKFGNEATQTIEFLILHVDWLFGEWRWPPTKLCTSTAYSAELDARYTCQSTIGDADSNIRSYAIRFLELSRTGFSSRFAAHIHALLCSDTSLSTSTNTRSSDETASQSQHQQQSNRIAPLVIEEVSNSNSPTQTKPRAPPLSAPINSNSENQFFLTTVNVSSLENSQMTASPADSASDITANQLASVSIGSTAETLEARGGVAPSESNYSIDVTESSFSDVTQQQQQAPPDMRTRISELENCNYVPHELPEIIEFIKDFIKTRFVM